MSTSRFPRELIRKLESQRLPIQVLEAVRALRAYLDVTEEEAILRARGLGASTKDIAEALGLSRQGVYHKLRSIEERRGTRAETVVIPELEPKSR